MNFLEEIVAYKKQAVKETKDRSPLSKIIKAADARKERRDFAGALKKNGRIALIAEVKKASPSAGIIREDFDPVAIARIYEDAKADAISVLTEERFFQGSLKYLGEISRSVDLPLLRKDFIIDEYQIVEAAACGADAVLLIAAILSRKELEKMTGAALENRLSVLVEVHSEDDLKKALDAGARIIGINNRDLKTFKTDLKTTEVLLPKIPSDMVRVSESGIRSREDVEFLMKLGVDAVLIGETFMKSRDIGKKVKEIMGYHKETRNQ